MHWKSFWKSYSSLRCSHTQMISSIYTEHAQLFTWTFWTCASQMKSGISDILDPRPGILLASTTDPNLNFLLMVFYTSEQGMHMRELISSFLVTFFSPAGLFPTAGLGKQRKKHTSTSSPESSRFLIWRRQGRGLLLPMFLFITTTFMQTFLWGVWKIQRK